MKKFVFVIIGGILGVASVFGLIFAKNKLEMRAINLRQEGALEVFRYAAENGQVTLRYNTDGKENVLILVPLFENSANEN